MDLQNGDERCFQVVGLGLLGVESLDWESSTGDRENRTFPEEIRKLVGIESCGGTNETKVRTTLARF
jgi:hypothetical protein